VLAAFVSAQPPANRYRPRNPVVFVDTDNGLRAMVEALREVAVVGLDVETVPADFVDKIEVLGGALGTISSATVLLGLACLAFLILQRRYAPKLPGFLLVVVVASLLVALGGLSTDTIGSRFGGIDSSLPVFALPAWNWAKVVAVLPDAFTIAFSRTMKSLLTLILSKADGFASIVLSPKRTVP
jgi:SulP family sulfate permease